MDLDTRSIIFPQEISWECLIILYSLKNYTLTGGRLDIWIQNLSYQNKLHLYYVEHHLYSEKLEIHLNSSNMAKLSFTNS
jgi:hypothetical protein